MIENNYTLKVTSGDGSKEKVYVLVVPAVGIEENMAPVLNMYPNPVTRLLTIELSNFGPVAPMVKIFSITGQAVYNARYTGNRLEIDLSHMDSGLYFVTVQAGDYHVTRKLQVVK
jgi:hypothetical protein